MSLENDLAIYLQTKPALNALINKRIQYASDPQALAYPKVTLSRVDTKNTYSNAGFTGHAVAVVQVDCLSPQLEQAKAIAAQVKSALRGYQGMAGSTYIGCVTLENERDIPAPLEGGQSKPIQKTVLALRISFTEN